ncbi:MAG: hypothetical protein IJU62_03380 [Muribaculaceae bacterium]|nr:hypothetical protein [Muribaculaceae bacterium]
MIASSKIAKTIVIIGLVTPLLAALVLGIDHLASRDTPQQIDTISIAPFRYYPDVSLPFTIPIHEKETDETETVETKTEAEEAFDAGKRDGHRAGFQAGEYGHRYNATVPKYKREQYAPHGSQYARGYRNGYAEGYKLGAQYYNASSTDDYDDDNEEYNEDDEEYEDNDE